MRNATPIGFSIDDNIMNLPIGWFLVYNDGTVITENQADWNKVSKFNIKTLGLKWGEKFWTISGKSSYVQFKRGAASFSLSGDFSSDIECLEHCIGYYEGKSKIIYRVNHYTGQMRLDVKDVD